MLTTGPGILNYQGNAGLSNADSGLTPDTSVINQSIANLAYVNLQKNREVWQQKIRDRDDAMTMLKQGNIDMGKVPPEYQDQLREKVQKFKDFWFENGGDIKSDPNNWAKANSLLSDFTDDKNYAQSKLIEYNKEAELASKETNPTKRTAILQNMKDNMASPLNKPYMPYQQTLDWDPAKVDLAPPMKILKNQREGDFDVLQQAPDLEKYRQMYYDQWVNNKSGDVPYHMESFLSGFLGNDGIRPPEAVKQNLDLVNQKLAKINTDLGLAATDPQYLKPIIPVAGPDDKIHLSDNTAESVYKIMLAKNYSNVAQKKFNLNYAKERQINSQIGLNQARAEKERSYIPLNRAKAKYWNSKGTETENVNHVQNIFEDVLARTKNLEVFDKDNKSLGTKRLIDEKDLPEGFSTVLGGLDEKGVPIKLEPIHFRGGNYYEVSESPFYVNGSTGKRYSDAEIKDAFDKQTTYSKYDDFIKAMKEKGIAPEIELQGKNGRGTSQSTIQALRALNNKSRSQKTDEVLSGANDNEGGSSPDQSTTTTSESSGGETDNSGGG